MIHPVEPKKVLCIHDLLRRTTRKVVKGAENAVLQLDKMVGDFVEKHMEG